MLAGRRRRLAPREAARLQGLPDWFDFGAQADAATYKQLGNGVNVGVAYYLLVSMSDETVRTYREEQIADAVFSAPSDPGAALGCMPTVLAVA